MDEPFDAVYERHGSTIHAYLTRLTGNAWTAEEVLQETFLRYLAHRRSLVDSNGSVRGWLLRVATNLAIDGFRRKRGTSLAVEPEGRSSGDPVEDRDVGRRVRAELEDLPAELRGTFLLRAHHGLPFRDVAAAFGVSERAAKDRFRKVRDLLARRLAHLIKEEDRR